jgi:hypothetical protein
VAQVIGTQFLIDELFLHVNAKHDHIQQSYKKLSYLGVDIWPNNRRLQPKVNRRIYSKVTENNFASY